MNKQSNILFVVFLAAFSIFQLNYKFSLVIGCLGCVSLLLVILFPLRQTLQACIIQLNLTFALVCLPVYPLSQSTWSIAHPGSGVINTPLTKLYLILLIFLSLRKLRPREILLSLALLLTGASTYLLFYIANVHLPASFQVPFLSQFLFLSVLSALSSDRIARIFISVDPIWILEVSTFCIGLRVSLLLLTNQLRFTDYLTVTTNPIIASTLFFFYFFFRVRPKPALVPFLLLALLPAGKTHILNVVLAAFTQPTLIILFLIVASPIAVTLALTNPLISLKVLELLSIVNPDTSDMLNLAGSGSATSLGVRSAELSVLFNRYIEHPFLFFTGSTHWAIPLNQLERLTGQASTFDYTLPEIYFSSVVNLHGFLNTLLFLGGLPLLLLYIYLTFGRIMLTARKCIPSTLLPRVITLLFALSIFLEAYSNLQACILLSIFILQSSTLKATKSSKPLMLKAAI